MEDPIHGSVDETQTEDERLPDNGQPAHEEGQPAPEQGQEGGVPEVKTPAPDVQSAPETAEAFLRRYEIEGEDALKDIIGKAQSYAAMKESYDKLEADLRQARSEIALRDANVLKERYDDVQTWFRGKGIDMDEKALAKAIESHPEWIAQHVQIGGNPKTPEQKRNTDSEIAHMFGLPGFVS